MSKPLYYGRASGDYNDMRWRVSRYIDLTKDPVRKQILRRIDRLIAVNDEAMEWVAGCCDMKPSQGLFDTFKEILDRFDADASQSPDRP